MRNENLRAAILVVAFFTLSAWMALGWLRYPPNHRFVMPETPFENTPGLDEARWTFLLQAGEILPVGASYTVRAADTGVEMRLFMLAGSLLVDQKGLPTSYYDEPMAAGAEARWVLSWECRVVPDGARVVRRLEGGCVCDRGE